MRKIKAEWLYPISQAPIEHGLLVLNDHGFIQDIFSPTDIQYSIDSNTEQYAGSICPGFVNTHCHLELSYLKNKIAEHIGLDEFIKQVEIHKTTVDEVIQEAIILSDKEMQSNGIVAVGDISNTDTTFKFKKQSSIHYYTFIELYAFSPERAELAYKKGLDLAEAHKLIINANVSIVPHAPYSVSERLLSLINDYATHNQTLLSIHNQETPDENELFKSKSGKILDRLNKWGIDTSGFQASGKNSLESTIRHLPKNNKTLLVHNTSTIKSDIEWALQYSSNLWWCLCPNANKYIENKLPDFSIFPSNRITIGTDSLASNHQLSVLSELQTIKRNYANISWHELLRWGTLNGAQFLGIDGTYGSFEKGKKPGLVFIKNEQLF